MAIFAFYLRGFDVYLGSKIENVNGSDAEIIENQETKRLEDDFLQ